MPSSHSITTGLRSDYAGARVKNAGTRPRGIPVHANPVHLKGGFEFISWGLDVVIVRRLGSTIIGQTIKSQLTQGIHRSTTSRTIASVSMGVFGN